jgi:hypothetical protein
MLCCCGEVLVAFVKSFARLDFDRGMCQLSSRNCFGRQDHNYSTKIEIFASSEVNHFLGMKFSTTIHSP